MRSISDSNDFVDIIDPRAGKITMCDDIPKRRPYNFLEDRFVDLD